MTAISEKQTISSQLLEKERDALNDFFDKLAPERLEAAIDFMAGCSGLILLTGVGKSGLIAEKIAQTLTSTGTRSLFLSPTNSLHGDLGIAREGDLVIILSKSGESQELLELLPYLRNRNVKTLAIACNQESRLCKNVDFPLILPQEPEICPFDLAPTTSTTMQLIVGDVLAVGLMRRKNISLEEFASSHPAGRIGKRILVRVQDLMIVGDAIPRARESDLLVEVLVELTNKRCGCVLVIDGMDRLSGIFTDGDLRRSLQKFGSAALQMRMDILMTKDPRTTTPSELAVEALSRMESDQKHLITVLPVVNKDKVAGLIRMHDIVQTGI